MASGLHAAGLFLPVDPAKTGPVRLSSAQKTASADPNAWERHVRIARHELAAARDDVEIAGAGRLLLNVKDSIRLDMAVERTAPTKWGYSLSGRVAGDSMGFVTLVVHEDAVAGSIWTPEASYEVSYLGSGVHALREVTNARPVECGGALPPESSAADAATQGGTDDGSVVDILVVWTPAAREEWGGTPQVLSRIDLLVAWTNDAFERSGVFVALNLVGAEQVDYVEADRVGTDLGRLGNPNDGFMDGVHERRDALGADLVYLLTRDGPGIPGIANLLGPFGVGHGHGSLFAHEIGHNFGLHHERYQSWGGAYAYGFTAGHCSTTIMSYGVECLGHRRFFPPLYASPWRYDPRSGRALGTTRLSKERGVRGPADATLALNRNRHLVAKFRPSRSSE